MSASHTRTVPLSSAEHRSACVEGAGASCTGWVDSGLSASGDATALALCTPQSVRHRTDAQCPCNTRSNSARMPVPVPPLPPREVRPPPPCLSLIDLCHSDHNSIAPLSRPATTRSGCRSTSRLVLQLHCTPATQYTGDCARLLARRLLTRLLTRACIGEAAWGRKMISGSCSADTASSVSAALTPHVSSFTACSAACTLLSWGKRPAGADAECCPPPASTGRLSSRRSLWSVRHCVDDHLSRHCSCS